MREDSKGEFDDDVATLLVQSAEHAAETGLEFAPGSTAVLSYLHSHRDKLATRAKIDKRPDREQEQIFSRAREVGRVYQVSPSSRALRVLLAWKMTSSADIVDLSYALFERGFRREFLNLFPGATETEIVRECRLVCAKAQQVTSVTANVFAGVQTLISSPMVQAISAGADNEGELGGRLAALAKLLEDNKWMPVHNSDLKEAEPTLASLFGDFDFCECEHCESVLGPPAYLVDLLEFLNLRSGCGQRSKVTGRNDTLSPMKTSSHSGLRSTCWQPVALTFRD